jgi:hypothetical protein
VNRLSGHTVTHRLGGGHDHTNDGCGGLVGALSYLVDAAYFYLLH